VTVNIEDLRKAACEALIKASTTFRPDQLKAYENANSRETNPKAKWVLEQIRENAHISAKERVPLCDDTGIPHPFLEVGENVEVAGGMHAMLTAITQGIADGLRKLPGRPMAVKGGPLESLAQSKGLDADSGALLPAPLSIRAVPGNELRLTILMLGGGPELRSKTYHVFHKHEKMRVLETAAEWAVEMAALLGCTPCVPAVGIGRTHLEASSLMLEAMKEGRFDQQSDLERFLTDKINQSETGPLGMGGSYTALASFVRIGPQRGSGFRILSLRMGCCFDPRKATINLK